MHQIQKDRLPSPSEQDIPTRKPKQRDHQFYQRYGVGKQHMQPYDTNLKNIQKIKHMDKTVMIYKFCNKSRSGFSCWSYIGRRESHNGVQALSAAPNCMVVSMTLIIV